MPKETIMDMINEYFRESSERDRGFPIDEARWSQLELSLGQRKRRRWMLLWWSFLGLVLLGAVTKRIRPHGRSGQAACKQDKP